MAIALRRGFVGFWAVILASLVSFSLLLTSCSDHRQKDKQAPQPSLSAAEILTNGKVKAIAYGSYRTNSRSVVATVEEIKEDLRILSALGFELIRTYNTQQFDEVRRLLIAIDELKQEDPNFSMYVMLGVWIDCEGAFTDAPDHTVEDVEANGREIAAAVAFAQAYPETIKIIAVGNEAMVHWASAYFVGPEVILKWVNHLQSLKQQGQLPIDIWITSSDNFASWGGGDAVYHNEALRQLIEAVDYVSMHTYPFHDTHYNPDFWRGSAAQGQGASVTEDKTAAIGRALIYAEMQFDSTYAFVQSVSPGKPVHIGETGWASADNKLYGANGSNAAGEAAQALYFDGTLAWTQSRGISAVMFEAFDEPWKDAENPGGSENHFGLIGGHYAKAVLWEEVDQGVFEGLTRGGHAIVKSRRH
ncbi:MAG: glycosyl hydrolase family 17 protein [Proteobacteria bacterium]|nr:glycosyl hydrolase family 17 protein [Pseudomonadota bacterium]MDA0957847.1 glycosyl hydrolase family 17 protein [Pseudomonadota bacterium]